MEQARNKKGQSIVEFAMLLAFVTLIGLFARDGGLLDAASSVLGPAKEILYKIDHYRSYDLNAPIYDAISGIVKVQDYYKEGGDNPRDNQRNFRRGMVRSGWIDDEPPKDSNGNNYNLSLINTLRDELGAAQWTYLNSVNETSTGHAINAGNYTDDFKGFYWTVRELTMDDGLTAYAHNTKNNFSNEKVLQYFYHYDENTKEGLYFVIKSHVWIEQKDVENQVALGALGKQYSKPAGVYVQMDANGTLTDVQADNNTLDKTMGFKTLQEAKTVFEAALAENNGKLVFE